MNLLEKWENELMTYDENEYIKKCVVKNIVEDFKIDYNKLIKDKQELIESLKIITEARVINKPSPQMNNSHFKEPCYVKVIYEQLDYMDELIKRMEETK